MNAKEFAMKYKNSKNKDEFMKKNLEVKNYIPFEQKSMIAERIVKNTCLDDNGNISVNSSARFYITYLQMIKVWTNIETDREDPLGDFNALDECGLVDLIVRQYIPESESAKFNTLIAMHYDDLITNRYEPHAYFSNIADKFSIIGSTFLKPLAKKIQEFDVSQLASNVGQNNE